MKPFLRYFGWIAAAAILIFILRRVDLPGLWEHIRETNPITFVWLAVFTLIANSLQGVRFQLLWPESHISWRRQIGLPFCMHTANIILPLRIGEAVRPLMLLRWNPRLKIKTILYWTLVDKALEAVSFLGFVVTAAYIFDQKFLPALALFLGGHGAFILFIRKTKVPLKRIVLPYLASLASWAANGMFFYMLLQPLKAGLGLFVGTSFASSIPLAPGGIGTFEAAFVWICGQFGVGETEAMARAVSSHSISILTTMAIGITLGTLWGWPKADDAEATQGPGVPTRFLVLNVVVYILAALLIITTGAFWIPSSRMPPWYKEPPETQNDDEEFLKP